MHHAYLALGSNLGDRVGHLLSARTAIASISGVSLQQSSSLYETPAWGSDSPQPDYLNAVLLVTTALTAHELWQRTATIEAARGRTRGADRNEARTLDIDLLLFNDMSLCTKDLIVPHPRMHLRQFVLLPLLEITPNLQIPGLGDAATLLASLTEQHACKRSDATTWR